MATDFRQLLIDSIPFNETDVFLAKGADTLLARARRNVDIIMALGVTTPEKMLNLLEDTRVDDELRRAIVFFAGWLEYKPAIQLLACITVSEVENNAIRQAAMIYLASMDPSRAFTVLESLSLNHPDPNIRDSAISALSYISGSHVFRLLSKIIAQDINPEVRGAAIRAISLVITQRDKELAFELLLSKFMDSKENTIVRAYAVEGLGNLEDTRALDIILRNLTNEAPEIRFMCAYSLGLMGDQSHLLFLEALLTDDAVFEDWGTVADAAEQAIEDIHNRFFCRL